MKISNLRKFSLFNGIVSPTNEFTTDLKNGSKRDEKKVSKFYVSVGEKMAVEWGEGKKKGKKGEKRLF